MAIMSNYRSYYSKHDLWPFSGYYDFLQIAPWPSYMYHDLWPFSYLDLHMAIMSNDRYYYSKHDLWPFSSYYDLLQIVHWPSLCIMTSDHSLSLTFPWPSSFNDLLFWPLTQYQPLPFLYIMTFDQSYLDLPLAIMTNDRSSHSKYDLWAVLALPSSG